MKMRYLLIIFLSFCSLSYASAEYNGYHIHFTITTTKGRIINAYTFLGADYISKDSLQNQPYLKTVLNFAFSVKEGTFNYCTRRTSFQYPVAGEKEQDTLYVNLYSISGMKRIPTSSILEIKILDMLDQGTGINIYNPSMIHLCHNNLRPILEIRHAGGYLCEYDVIVYRKSPKIIRIFKQLETLDNTNNEDELNDSDVQEDDYKKGDELDRKVEALIHKIRKKAIIIQSCTC